MSIITTKNITKEYPSKSFSKDRITALSKFTFNVKKGEIFGLLGPNGAGKTTLIKILLGITFPNEGEAQIFDKDVSNESIKSKIGYLPEDHKFPNYLNGEQVLRYFGRLSGMNNKEVKKKSDEFLELVDMHKWRKTKIKKYSKGMIQRLGMAQAIMNDPELIFLDEPTDGVDPIGRKEIRDILLNLRSLGKTVFLNSHLLSEIELICDRVAILNKGVLIKEGSIEEMTTSKDNYKFVTSEMGEDIVNTLLSKHKAVLQSKHEFLYRSDDLKGVNKVIDFLRSKNVLIEDVSKEKNTLESMFIDLIEQQSDDVKKK
ncbi:MAG: ABC transporter ATP-binding protein [Bacteroidetes bacterium]|nr:ABC transporter ATP-binding protein [Bacteroidota bacterium]